VGDTPASELARRLERLIALAERDAELAKALRGAAEAVLALLPPERELPPIAEPAEAGGEETFSPPASAEDVARLMEGFPLGAPAPALEAEGEPPEFNLEEVAANLRLKAEACRWLEAHGYTDDYGAIAARNQLIDRGRVQSCYLWMFDLKVVNPFASELHGRLAERYHLTTEGLVLWQGLEGEAEEVEAAQLLAEAQASLRVAVAEARDLPSTHLEAQDDDQRAIFEELREFARLNEVYLNFLSLSQVPDPLAPPSLAERMTALRERLEHRAAKEKRERQTLNRLAYHARQLERGSHQPNHDRAKVVEAVHALVENGLPESAPAFDAPLEPILPLLTAGPTDPLLDRVLAYVKRRRSEGGEEVTVPEAPSPEVVGLAPLVAGKTILLIGGEPQREAALRLETALGCHVHWLTSEPHQSHYDFEPAIARGEVAVVVLLIRWSSHAFSEVAAFCRTYDKPLVRAPSGYGVNRLARAILNQASQQLAA
jgi:hypothetical protein